MAAKSEKRCRSGQKQLGPNYRLQTAHEHSVLLVAPTEGLPGDLDGGTEWNSACEPETADWNSKGIEELVR